MGRTLKRVFTARQFWHTAQEAGRRKERELGGTGGYSNWSECHVSVNEG